MVSIISNKKKKRQKERKKEKSLYIWLFWTIKWIISVIYHDLSFRIFYANIIKSSG